MAVVDDLVLRATLRQEVTRGLDQIIAELRILNATQQATQRQARQTGRRIDSLGDQARQAARRVTTLTASLLGLNAAMRGANGLVGGIKGIQGETKLLIGLFATLIPAAVPVFAVLTASALAAGSAVTSLGVAVGVLALAFSGVGEAVSALASGDMDKINESFANLSNAGQDFARTLFGLKPLLDTLRGTAQEAVLPGVQDALLTLTSIMPNLTALVAVFGGAIGQVAQQFAAAFTSTGFTNFLQFLTDNVADLNRMADAVITLGSAIGDLFVAFYPLNATFGSALTGSINQFAAFASGATGTLSQFLTYVEKALPYVGDFLTTFGTTLLDLLTQLGNPGITVLRALTGILSALDALAPTVGALAEAIGVGLLGVVTALVPIIEQVGTIFGDALIAGADAVTDALIELSPLIGQLALFVSQQLLSAIETLTPYLPRLGEAFLDLLKQFEPLLPLLVDLIPIAGDALLGVFKALTPAIGGLIEALAPVILSLAEALAPILPIAADLLGRLVTALTPVIPLIGDALANAFNELVPYLPSLVDSFIDLVEQLPLLVPTVVDLFNALLPLAPSILELVNDTLPLIVTAISDAAPQIQDLADRFVRDLIPAVEGLVDIIDKLSATIRFLNGDGGDTKAGQLSSDAAQGLLSQLFNPFGRFTKGFGDTAMAHGSGNLGTTMAAHSSLMGGGVAISNALVGGGGLGPGSGDHQAGRALDLVGPGTGAYAARAKAAGHFAEYHGTGAGRHLHVAYRRPMGDTARSMASTPLQTVSAGGDSITVVFQGPVYGLDDFEQYVSAAVDEKNRQAAARRRNG